MYKVNIVMNRLFIFCFLLLGCSTPNAVNNPVIVSQVEYVQQTPFPPKPTQKEYTRKPIIESINEKDFVVSDEFVENSVLLKKYSDKITLWKQENKVK